MIYAVSDIHGCWDKYKKLLKKIHFGPDDTLYVLGDVIDRGPAGFKILLDMARRPNVINLMGNHEAMALDALASILALLRSTVSSFFLRKKLKPLISGFTTAASSPWLIFSG